MKRPWFQYHLSTAIILMFVAGGLLWLNLTERFEDGVPPDEELTVFFDAIGAKTGLLRLGWPRSFRTQLVGYVPLPKDISADELSTGMALAQPEVKSQALWIKGVGLATPIGPPIVFWGGVAFDAALAVAALLTTACVLEYRIRRQRRTTNDEPQTVADEPRTVDKGPRTTDN
jgi:hypothetical protein